MTVPAKFQSVIAIEDSQLTNSATASARIDTRGFDYATIIMQFGAEVNTNAVGPTISLLEDDTTVVSNFATFDSNFERSAEDLTSAKQVRYNVDLRGRQRYLRLTVTTATTTNDNVTVSAIALLSWPFNQAGTADQVESGGVCVEG